MWYGGDYVKTVSLEEDALLPSFTLKGEQMENLENILGFVNFIGLTFKRIKVDLQVKKCVVVVLDRPARRRLRKSTVGLWRHQSFAVRTKCPRHIFRP